MDKETPGAGDADCRGAITGAFSTTHWSVVLAARDCSSESSRQALESLCRSYWYPLYVFIRRRGSSPQEAEDLTQAFFGDLLSKDALATVAREKGKFRTFLLVALTNYLNNQYEKAKAQKRGGKYLFQSWDQLQAEERYRHEPVDALTPEKLFERRYAYNLVDQVLADLRRDYESVGNAATFDCLSPFLGGESTRGGPLATAAAGLGMSEGAVKVALHRLRRRFAEGLRNRVASTVASADQVDEEIRYLFSVISS